MSKMKKFVSIKGVIDNIRQSVNTPSPTGGGSGGSGSGSEQSSVPAKLEQDVVETLSSHHFAVEHTVRHGFPFKPISVAFDPIQKLLAIGNREGSVRILGRPGIDIELQHENRTAQVMQIEFMHNSGQLVTACTDDTLNLWDFKKRKPELVQSLQLSREHITTFSLEFQVCTNTTQRTHDT